MLLALLISLSQLLPAPGAQIDSLNKKLAVHDFVIIGNRVTRKEIILREIPFSVNDSLDEKTLNERLLQSKQNLLNTSLFNYVTVDKVVLGSQADIYITVVERWYTWPLPILEITEPNLTVWWLNKDLHHLNYGAYLVRYNFRGRKENIQLKLQFGFTQQYALFYNVPYLDRKQKSGMALSFGYSYNHEIVYGTAGNKLLFYKNNDEYVRRELNGRVRYYYREGIYNTHSFELRYNYGRVSDTITYLQTDYYSGNKTSTQFLTLSYLFRRDCRDSKVYPLEGYYIDGDLTRFGLGMLKGEATGITKAEFAAKGFAHLGGRFYAAAGIKLKVSDKPARQYYFIQRGLGYGEYVRGYEYYVIDAQSYALLRTNLKYEIIKPHNKTIPFLGTEKFAVFHYALYGNLFFDAGNTQDEKYYRSSFLANKSIWGTGAGIDFVSYYDIVVRFEVAMNDMKEKGFFIHFASPI